ncbi:MAG: hypothetical protein HYS39_02590 [Proteobacteria bacterium]|nr:hypothetical protein [Pseudomonadota bacterium]
MVPTKELEKVAQRLVWFKEPKEALKDPYTFITHVMTYGTLEDLLIVKQSLGMRAFKETLNHLPPGIIDVKSWAYWTLITNHTSSSSPPERNIQ